MPSRSQPEAHLPLSPQALEILIALGGGPAHGYGIISEIDAQSGGAIRLSTSSLYAALKRLEASGLVADAGRLAEASGGPPRRYFRITDQGRRVAQLEAIRLRGAAVRAAERFLDPEARPSGDG